MNIMRTLLSLMSAIPLLSVTAMSGSKASSATSASDPGPICPSYVAITMPPPSSTYQSTVNAEFEYGEIDTSGGGPMCVAGGTILTDVTVNSSDRTSFFSFAPGAGFNTVGTGTNIPLYMSVLNTLAVTATGYDEWGTPGYYSDVATTSQLYLVAVTPASDTISVETDTAGSQQFSVQNLSGSSAMIAFTGTCSGTLTLCSTTPDSAVIGAGASSNVTVSFNGQQGGSVILKATYNPVPAAVDSGIVQVVTGSPGHPSVTASGLNAGAVATPDMCLTAAAGSDAAYDCGDLRMIHELPSTKTFNKARAPTLIYNSQHAHPFPTVAVNVGMGSVSLPIRVEARLLIGGVQVSDTAKWPGVSWQPGGSTRRIVVGFDAINAGLNTGVYPYLLEIASIYSSGRRLADTVSDTLTIINRSTSAFGAGWWVAGVEQLSTVDANTKLWVGGDGSARLYRTTGISNVWAAPALDRPDTLKYNGSEYIRYLPEGIRVHFDGAGQHVKTIARVRDTTIFTYSSSRLTQIALPTPGSARTYQFKYDGSNRLDSVVAPTVNGVARLTLLSLPGSGSNHQVNSITDPDGQSVSFTYDSTITYRIRSRTDRRGTVTRYAFDNASKLRQSSMEMDTVVAHRIVNMFRPLESFGKDSAGVAQAGDTLYAYTRLDGPRSDIDGDTTLFWLDKYGAPRKIVNAVGDVTVLSHSTTFPALVDTVTAPGGMKTIATYDARGNLDSTRAVNPYTASFSQNTKYTWDTRWDFIASISPRGGPTTSFAYDTVYGNRLWQRIGPNDSTRIQFKYDPQRLLVRTVLPDNGGDTLYYDGQGNFAGSKTPLGFRQQAVNDDIGRVVQSFYDMTDTTMSGKPRTYRVNDSTFYDVMGRDTLSVHTAPGDSSVINWNALFGFPGSFIYDSTLWHGPVIRLRKTFDAEGNVLTATRHAFQRVMTFAGMSPSSTVQSLAPQTTQFVYDRAHRNVKEIDALGHADSTVYDLAGNALVQRTRRGDAITMVYDALNRLTRKIVPQVAYARDIYAVDSFPHYRSKVNGSLVMSSVTIPADTQTFTYDDASGQLQTAFNNDARITRQYFPNGQMQSEEQIIGTWAATGGDRYTKHVFDLNFRYDSVGRRRAMVHPTSLLGLAAGDSTRYTYTPLGQLATITIPHGDVFSFQYDSTQRPYLVTYPNSVTDQKTWDRDQRMTARVIGNASTSQFAGGVIHNMDFTYDTRGRRIEAHAGDLRTKSQFTPNGQLARVFEYLTISSTNFLSYNTLHGYDALANPGFVLRRSSKYTDPIGLTEYFYDSLSARSVAQQSVQDGMNTPATANDSFDLAGNQRFTHRFRMITRCEGTTSDCAGDVFHGFIEEKSASYYGADQKLRVVDRIADDRTVAPGGLERYRYDALGRRVAREFRRDCRKFRDTGVYPCTYLGESLRSVYDGDQVLYEIKSQSADSSSAADREADLVNWLSPPTPFERNGVVQYTHGLDLDQPLAATRMDIPTYQRGGVLYPHPGRLGKFDIGTRSGGILDSAVFWFLRHLDYTLRPMVSEVADVENETWYGSLLNAQSDGSQLVHMRNRYYDPASGQFTQEDPIGLAGGLNLYGFANGDPVNFSDPFGLCTLGKDCWEAFKSWLHRDGPLDATRILGQAGRMVGPVMLETGGARAAAGAAGSSIGAARRLEYQASPKHGAFSRGNASAGPVNGQDALDFSLKLTANSPRRIGIDYDANSFVVFDQTVSGVFHGHVRTWSDLTQTMRNTLVNSGMANSRGTIVR